MQIYIHKNNQQLGPFTEEEIKAQLASGAISLEDPVWWQGQADWIPLGQSPLASVASATTLAPSTSIAVVERPPVPVPGTPSGEPYVPQLEHTSGMAIASLVCSFFCCCLSIPAVILGHIALSEIKKNPLVKGRGLATAGLIIGYLGVALLLFSILSQFVLVGVRNHLQETLQQLDQQLKSEQSNPANPSDN
jgi:Domain of unknown function (DUF4190)/GYF domain 2